jgi:hypothetical protein
MKRKVVFVVVPPGASGAKGRMERQASNSGRLEEFVKSRLTR